MPALKPRQSADLRKVGGMAENEDAAIRAGAGSRQRAKCRFGVFCGLAFLMKLRVSIGALRRNCISLLGTPQHRKQGRHMGSSSSCFNLAGPGTTRLARAA